MCAFVCVCLCTFTGQAVGGDAWQSLSADIAEGRSGMRAGVPVVHPREMLHVELAGLGDGVGGEIWKERTTTSVHRVKLAELRRWKHRRTKEKSSERYIRITSPGEERYCRMGRWLFTFHAELNSQRKHGYKDKIMTSAVHIKLCGPRIEAYKDRDNDIDATSWLVWTNEVHTGRI